jgi:hypothetical protein
LVPLFRCTESKRKAGIVQNNGPTNKNGGPLARRL